MTYGEILILAIGLSMDAFAVAICKGLAVKKFSFKNGVIVGAWFGIFQTLMPLIGYALGTRFKNYIVSIDHWVVLVLLTLIGLNMIKESFSKDNKSDDSLSFKKMLLLAIATSIDALAVGISLAFLSVNLLISIVTIGIITFAFSTVGVKIGNIFGIKYKSKAEFFGGVILILIGLKISLEHLGVL